MAAGALKYIPRIFDALTSLPQEKLTARQARKHLKANVSKQELESTLPDLSSFPDDAPVTRSSLEQTAKENPFGIEGIRKSGTSKVEIDHDFIEDQLDAEYNDIDMAIDFNRSALGGAYTDQYDDAAYGTVSEFVKIKTPQQRQQLLEDLADHRFGIDGNMNTETYNARSEWMNSPQNKQFREDPGPFNIEAVINQIEDSEGAIRPRNTQYRTRGPSTDAVDEVHFTRSEAETRVRDQMKSYFDSPDTPGSTYGGTEYGPETGMGVTSPGPYSNYTETLAQLKKSPDTTPSLDTDTGFKEPDDFKGGHWGSEFPNIMWHTRQSTRPMHSIQDPVTKQSIPQNNAPGSLGEEFQDDWEAKVREFGSSPNPYRDVDLVQYSNERENLLRDTRKEYVPGQGGDNPNTAKNAYDFYDKKTMKPRREGEAHPGPRATPPRGAEGFTGYGETAEEAKASTLGFLNRLGTRVNRAAPEHPYASKTSEKAFRQAMAEAVDNNSPGLMWTTGKEQLQRTPHSDFPDKRKGLRSAYDDRIKKIANTIGKKFNTRVTTARTNTNANTLPGQERSYNAFFDDPADFATELKNYPVPSDLKITEELFGPVLRNKGEFVGEELNRNFYDFANAPVPSSRKQSPLMLPNVVKTRRDMLKESAENTQKQHYLPFTPELIAAIKKGIPLSVLTAFGLNNERESN
jgi:hypothetical protein